MNQPQITILPAPNCRRSRKVLAFLQEQGIPFEQIALDSPEGQRLQEVHQFRASPGILVDGIQINPYEILIQEQCRVDEAKARSLFQNGE
jgi:glutaredoxin